MKTKILADFQIWISVPLILTQKCDGVILSTLSMVIFLFFFFGSVGGLLLLYLRYNFCAQFVYCTGFTTSFVPDNNVWSC